MKKSLMGRAEQTFDPESQELSDFLFDPKRTHAYIEDEEDTQELPRIWIPVHPDEEYDFIRNYIPSGYEHPIKNPFFTPSEDYQPQSQKVTLDRKHPINVPYVVMDEIHRQEEKDSYEKGLLALREVEEARIESYEWASDNVEGYEEYNYYSPLGEDRTLFTVGEDFVEELYGGSVIVEKSKSYVSLSDTKDDAPEPVDTESILTQIRELANSKEIPINVKLGIIENLYESYM